MIAFVQDRQRASAVAPGHRPDRRLSRSWSATSQAQAVDSMIIDGEIVALDAGRARLRSTICRTGAVEERRRRSRPRNVKRRSCMLCFDLLHFAGVNLRGAPYIDRRRYLSQCLLPTSHLQLVHPRTMPKKLYAASLASGFEGIVAKRKDSTYQPGKRTDHWVKIKAMQTAEFVSAATRKGRAPRGPRLAAARPLASGQQAALCRPRGLRSRRQGHRQTWVSASGSSSASRRRSSRSRRSQRPTTWLDPELVVEVSFAEWTPDGMPAGARVPAHAR